MVLKEVNQEEYRLDWLKWAISVALILAGLIGNHYYSQVSMPLRVLGWLGVLAVAAFVASKTQKGTAVLDFFRASRMEMRKVVWPTREETVQTTMVVAVMVVILAMVLWGMDGLLIWTIGWLTGQRG